MARLTDEAVAAGLQELAKLKRGEMPSDADLDGAPILAGWFVEDISNGYQRLGGFVTGHPTIRPGWCWTSVLLFISDDRTWARTISRYYRLGSPLTIDPS